MMAIWNDDETTQMRNETLMQFRMLAMLGQISTLLFVRFFWNFELDYRGSFAIIFFWLSLNIVQLMILPRGYRLESGWLTTLLLIDMFEMITLLYLTGGAHNLFMFLIAAPVILGANLLPLRYFLTLVVFALSSFLFLYYFHKPIIYNENVIDLGPLLSLGHVVAVTISMLFVSIFTRRITRESLNMTEALAASDLALQRELRLSSLGGLVAAYAHELGTPLANIRLAANDLIEEKLPNQAKEDALSIREEIIKISQILQNMGKLGKDDLLIRTLPFSALIDEAALPHQERGKKVVVQIKKHTHEMPMVRHSAALVHGLRNIIQNAVDFADSEVLVQVFLERFFLIVRILDDGDGYPIDIINHIGEPYLKSKSAKDERPGYQGMGLGLFISKRLLETTGAKIQYANKPQRDGKGAVVTISWRYVDIEVNKNDARSALGANPEQVK